MSKGVDQDCYDLAAKFLDEHYKANPPTQEQAKEDLKDLSEAIQEAIDDFLFSKEPG